MHSINNNVKFAADICLTFLGWGISPSQGLYQQRKHRHIKKHTHPHSKWDLKTQFQC